MASPPQQRVRKPMYQDTHGSCSVLVAKMRNEACLLSLPEEDQFRWLHRFYLVLDRIAEQHRVYKLYGGAHGFMMSTGVAEPDENHAATLLRFSLHLLQSVQSIRLPGMEPLDLVMVLNSGPTCSGLLGTTSLTYQIVGKMVTVARELHDTQCDLPFMLCSGMHAALKPSIAVELCSAGEVELLCAPGQRERVYTLARYAGLPLSHPVHEAHVVAKVKQVQAQRAATHAATGQQQREEAAAGGSTAAAPPASPSAAAAPVPEPATASARCATAEAPQLLGPAFPSKPSGPPGDKGGREPGSGDAPQPQPVFKQPKLGASMGGSRHAALAPFRAATLHKGCNHSLPRNTGSAQPRLESDLLMRFANPALEASYARWSSEKLQGAELSWLCLGLFTALLYTCAALARSYSPNLLLVVYFQALPVLGVVLWRWRHETYLTYREGLWMAHRLLVLFATSLPGTFLFAHPTFMPAFAFGLCTLALEVVFRRVRLHLQLLSSLLTYVLGLTLMHLHPETSHARALVTPSYLSMHLLFTSLVPAIWTAYYDLTDRMTFQAQLQGELEELAAEGKAGGTAAAAVQ
ncbi:adenylyl cyclase Cya [Micractinium conductrix]|uniref:adenylate cyclase n=1 Tax=Micractinium conductrix TaxID=554055 RepID=A0A2P6VJZ9_9CHLO|nr:adenylyl cyclase Cya [Micractinium conductrix]|eukprot:PSC74422.1 adenylyl cyclase Cya [Micractinium conductrix]